MKKILLLFVITLLLSVLVGCQKNRSSNHSDGLDKGVSAIEDAMSKGKTEDSAQDSTQQEEGALDVARAVRFIRKNADVYGIDSDAIAVMGFSAGGIQAGEFLMHYDEDVDGTALDSSYVPDQLDKIPAHTSAAGMIYSFYGRLSVGNMDTDWLEEIFNKLN